MDGNDFWQAITTATDPTNYRPKRREDIVVSRLETREAPYYVLKQPRQRNYLRLSESDYALWWQMDGRHAIKDILFYNLKRFKTLPIGHFNRLIEDLRQGEFLQDIPANLYQQAETQLTARQPASRGKKLLNGFLHTEIAVEGLDNFFTTLYRFTSWLYHPIIQILLVGLILLGGGLFSMLFLAQTYTLVPSGVPSFISLLIANLLIIMIHELGHGLTTKHFGRELNRGGFLIYWGMPAFFVDTRDTWLSPRKARIAVSWAGPHTGLLMGAVMGVVLTIIRLVYPEWVGTFWPGFLYQLGFIAYLSVFFNLNPLLELDGYFILMDWLDMPGLRHRALRFWRSDIWRFWREPAAQNGEQTAVNPLTNFWRRLQWPQRVFMFYGVLTAVYSTYAFFFALYFWQTRLVPIILALWQNYGYIGKMGLLLLTAVVIIPAIYALVHYGWSRIQAGLEWLARRDLLARPDVLALLIGVPLVGGLLLLFISLALLPQVDVWLNLAVWLIHLTTVMALIGVARQLPGSRLQWALWALVAAPVGMALAWLTRHQPNPTIHHVSILLTAVSIFIFGLVCWFIIWPRFISRHDRWFVLGTMLVGLLYTSSFYWLNGRLDFYFLAGSIATFSGMALMTPMWLNFWRTRFTLPWLLLAVSILTVPLLILYPQVQLIVIILWLYTSLLYLLVGALSRFKRYEDTLVGTAAYSERERLVDAFNHFMQAFFASYEAVFGRRRLAAIQAEIIGGGAIDPDMTILQISGRCQQALITAVDRLDDLAGLHFTRQAGQAAYDSLPWLEAETLGRQLLSRLEWGSNLAQGFIAARDRRVDLIRQADIFAGFDQAGVQTVLSVLQNWHGRSGTILGEQGQDATHFYLIEAGEVGVFVAGEQVGSIFEGGYCGTQALLATGAYEHTYRALSDVQAVALARDQFDPLLRADTTLAQQVYAGNEERNLLKRMALFSTLSPQQLTAVDARLSKKSFKPKEIIAREGQARSHLFIVAAGQVAVSVRDETGTEQVMGTLGPGEHFGEYALFADTPYQATYRALNDVELLLLDEKTFDNLVLQCEGMSHYVEQVGSGRLFATNRRLGLTAVFS